MEFYLFMSNFNYNGSGNEFRLIISLSSRHMLFSIPCVFKLISLAFLKSVQSHSDKKKGIRLPLKLSPEHK